MAASSPQEPELEVTEELMAPNTWERSPSGSWTGFAPRVSGTGFDWARETPY